MYYRVFTDLYDGKRVIVNVEDVSRVEELDNGSAIYFKEVTSDLDHTIKQVSIHVSESFDLIKSTI